MLSWLFIPTSFEILLNVSNSTLDEFGEIALKKQYKMIEDYLLRSTQNEYSHSNWDHTNH